MQIPHDRLAPDTLRALLFDYVTRDGTDYGEQEVAADAKIAQVLAQLQQGTVVIVFDAETESFDVLTREEHARRQKFQAQST
jgi:uncharacterized protein YheU (UPF0270 family)